MNMVIAVLGTAGLGSVALILLILARLTQKWEVVTKTKSYYHLFRVSAALVILASLTRLVRVGDLSTPMELSFLSEPQSWGYLCFYHAPLAIGVTVSLVVVWRNWGWLLRSPDG